VSFGHDRTNIQNILNKKNKYMEKLSTGSEILKKLLNVLNVTVYELANKCGYEKEQAYF
jgi:hypothetical protein